MYAAEAVILATRALLVVLETILLSAAETVLVTDTVMWVIPGDHCGKGVRAGGRPVQINSLLFCCEALHLAAGQKHILGLLCS